MPNLHTSSKDGKRRAGDVRVVHGSKPVPTHLRGSTKESGGTNMNTVAMGLSGVETTDPAKNIHAKSVPIVLALSLLTGLFAYFIFRAISTTVAQDNQILVLITFFVIGFELVWLAYGAFLGVLKIMHK